MPVACNGFPGRIEPIRRDVMPRKRIPCPNPGILSADNDLIKIVKQLIGTLIKEVGALGKVAQYKDKLIGKIRIYLPEIGNTVLKNDIHIVIRKSVQRR